MLRLALFIATTLLTSPLLAAERLTLFKGQGADTNFLDLGSDIINGDLVMDPTYFWGINYGREIVLEADDGVAGFLRRHRLTPEWELQLTRHEGLQDNYEAHLALLLRTSNLDLAGLRVNLAAGMGPSYAFSRPTYEDGPDGQPGDGGYQFQNYMTYELEFSLARFPQVTMPFRIHHRSGMYGLIAPRRVGSNFFSQG